MDELNAVCDKLLAFYAATEFERGWQPFDRVVTVAADGSWSETGPQATTA